MLYPLLFVISASFSDPKAVAGGEMLLLPINPSLEGYKYLMQYEEIWTGISEYDFLYRYWYDTESCWRHYHVPMQCPEKI